MRHSETKCTTHPDNVTMPHNAANRFDFALLANALENARDSNGQYDALRYEEVATILLTAYSFSGELPDIERLNVIWVAASTLRGTKPFTADSLRLALSKAEKTYLRSAPQKAELVTSISMRLPTGIHRRELLGGQIILSRSLPHRFRVAREAPSLKIPAEDVEPRGYTTIRVKTEGRSVHESVERAMFQLDLLRASWNFLRNRTTIIRWVSRPDEPINAFRTGRVQTLHSPSGASLGTSHWFVSNYRRRIATHLTANHWKSLDSTHRRFVGALRRHPYKAKLESAFVRYVRSLDGPEMETVFLKVWSLLEFLASGGGGNYDVTIRRILFLFRGDKLSKQVLEHLRQRRNLAVHEDFFAHGVPLTWQAKKYAEEMLVFHLIEGRKLDSLAEAAFLLDMPTSATELKKRQRLCRQALRLIK